jgi:hypothetical protein
VTGRAWRRPVYDVHPSDQVIRESVERGRETGADPLSDYWSSPEFDRDLMVKEGWPRVTAEQMALQHAREQALNEVQADLEAG